MLQGRQRGDQPPPTCPLSPSSVSDSSFMPGKLRRSRRGGLEEKRWRSLEEQGSARLGQPLLARWVLHLPATRPPPSAPPALHIRVPRLLPRARCPGLCAARSAGSAAAQPGLLLPHRSRTCDPPCRDTEPAAVAAAPLVSLGHRGPSVTLSVGTVLRSRGRGSGAGGCGVPVGPGLCPTRRPTSQPPPQLSERVADYCKAFGALAERDTLLGSFSCAWQREVLYRGHLYISSQHVCFCSSLLLKDIKVGWGQVWGVQLAARDTVTLPGCPAQVVVPVASISALKKTNTALLVPNALSIRTAQGEKVREGPCWRQLSWGCSVPGGSGLRLREQLWCEPVCWSPAVPLRVAAPAGGHVPAPQVGLQTPAGTRCTRWEPGTWGLRPPHCRAVGGAVTPCTPLHLSLSRTAAGAPWPLQTPGKSFGSPW